MKNINFTPSNLILSILLFISILPVLNLGSFGLPVLYLTLPIGGLVLLFIMFKWIKIPPIVSVLIFIFLLIVIEIFISTIYGSFTYFNKFIIPTDTIQYIARLLVFLVFLVAFYKGKFKVDTFIKYFLVILNLAMLIGILQWIPWPGRELFIQLYPFREGEEQLSMLNREIHNIRIHGVGQHATANGGLATFFFIIGFSVLQYYKKYKILSIILIILSITNVFASQARAGMLALVFSFLLFYLINMYVNKKSLKPTLYMFSAIGVIIFVVRLLYVNGNEFIGKMVYRWNVLFETSGGVRVDQIDYFLMQLNSPFQYLFGLSKQVINQSAYSHGAEIEAANIFFSYGIFGVLLQYGLVAVLAVYFIKHMPYSLNNKAILALLVASFVGLLSYQVFSVGFFFFREIRVGLFHTK